MKILNNIAYVLSKAFNWKVISWFCAFLALTLIAEIIGMSNVGKGTVLGAATAVTLINILLLIHFLGFLLLSAVGAKENKEKPIAAFFSKTVFTQGAKATFALFLTSLPLLMTWATLLYFGTTKELDLFFKFYLLLYVIFGFLPTWLQMVQEYPNYSVKNSLWQFLKKNASAVFACLFWSGVLLLAWSYLTEYVLILAQEYSTSPAQLAGFVFIPYFTLFYVIVAWAVLSGLFARAHATLTTEGEMQKPVQEEAKVEAEPVQVAPKKTVKKATHKRKTKKANK